MTVVVALAGFFLVRFFCGCQTASWTCRTDDPPLLLSQIPDKPGNARVRWLNTTEQRVAKLRMSRVNKLPSTVCSSTQMKLCLLISPSATEPFPRDPQEDLQFLAHIHLYLNVLVRSTFRALGKQSLTPLSPFLSHCSTWGWSQNSSTWIILFLKAQLNPDGTHQFGISERNAIPIGGCEFLSTSTLLL